MLSPYRVSLSFLAGILFAAPVAHAQTLGFSIIPVTSGPPPHGTAVDGGRQNFGSSLGLLFSLNAPLTITSLGYWDDYDAIHNLDFGIDTDLTVAIFDRNASGGPAIFKDGGNNELKIVFSGTMGTLVGTTVPNELESDPSGTPSGRTGQFRVADLATAFALPAGNYALVAWGYGDANQFLNGSSDGPVLAANSFGGILTFDGNRYDNTSNPGSYPTFVDLGNGVSGPLYTSATFAAIPEPSQVALGFATTALAGAVIVRRQKRAAGVR
jgi:hypothetical protein